MSTDPTPLNIGHIRYENGEGKVRISLGALVKDLRPSTARSLAIALIHAAEMAGLPPPPPDEDPGAVAKTA